MVIVAFGDSLTYGWMVEQGYIDVLDSMLRGRYPRALFRIVNRGIPGDTARGGYFRMQRHVIDERPDLVMIQFALNDALSGFSEDDFYGSLSQIVSGVQAETSAEILLLTSPLIYDEEMMNMARPYYDKIVQLGIEKSIPTARVDLYWREKIASGTDHASLVQSDMAHPTETGHRLMAEAAFELLV
jgi:lysophospholipase L1-like esterase